MDNDAPRRTRLANERTYLAWWRTALTTLAVSFGAGRLVPELSDGANWPFELIGIAFALMGVAFAVYGYVRYQAVERSLERGDYAGLPDRAAVVFALAGTALGVATVAVILVTPS